MIKAVVFDIDGTLTSEISWTTLTQKLGADVSVHKKIFNEYRAGTLTLESATEQLVGLWKATGNANRMYIQKVLDKWAINQEAYELVEYLRKKKLQLCLITGSFDLFAATVANKLDIDDWYANTVFKWHNNDLVDFEYHLDQAKMKLKHFEEFCNRYGLKATECVVVGDSENDIDIFKHTGQGISVKSDSSHILDAVAWKKVDGLIEIKNIIEMVNSSLHRYT